MSRRPPMEVIETAEYVTIGELARLTDVRYSTLKFYTEEGMLPFYQAEENLTRRYRREESVVRLQQIRDLRRQGKSIQEIKAMLTKDRESEPGWKMMKAPHGDLAPCGASLSGEQSQFRRSGRS